ncbi:hypothetical protein [Jiella sonneratiae]|uniref:Uncharacterized protein n=1 Tax=Jiella sonneratiae TaxID=2816856 RepID=A0ABS3IYD9_9HYPH|nr:hypothetical protein [Jiella sonneratiae]MBO0902429.1 hypothetical protein [Jiella sonneratiae]
MLPTAPQPRRPSPPRHREGKRVRRPWRARATAANVAAGLVVYLFAFLGLAVFRSGDLVSTTYDLPPGAASETVIAAAETWNGWMEDLGTAGLGEEVVETVGAFASGELFEGAEE